MPMPQRMLLILAFAAGAVGDLLESSTLHSIGDNRRLASSNLASIQRDVRRSEISAFKLSLRQHDVHDDADREGDCSENEQNLRLRGGAVRTLVNRRSTGSASSTEAKPKKKRRQPLHNLPPLGWRDKIKNADEQRKDMSGKGKAKGRKNPSFHFWTKKRIKTYMETRKIHREHVLKQQAKLPIKNFGRGVRRCKFKWLPSELEKSLIEQEELKRKEEEEAKKTAEKEEDKQEDEADKKAEPPATDVAGGSGDGDGGGKKAVEAEAEEEFMFPGMDGDSNEAGF